MKKTILFLLLLLIPACKEQVTNPTNPVPVGNIKGKMISPMDSTLGVPEIKLYLIDADFKIDTVKYNNRNAFIDSTITNKNGEYVFNIYKPGRYAVVPKEKDNFTFAFADTNQPAIIEVKKGESKTIDFKMKLSFSSGLVPGGYEFPGYKLKITLKNVNKVISNDGTKLFLNRRFWYLIIPYMVSFDWPGSVEPDGSYTHEMNMVGARICLFPPSFDNFFTVVLKNRVDDRVYLTNIVLPLELKSAYVIYDCEAKTTTYDIKY